MIIFKTAASVIAFIKNEKQNRKSVGFVPTMGALHEGHIALISFCRKKHDLSICSIFINPTQFNNIDDFAKYPVTIESDINKLERSGCDVLFLPSISEIYPENNEKNVYSLGYLETVLEGKYRPGHFQGVSQVVHRLLTIIQPDAIYLGQKDYQQCMVIKKLIELKKLDVNIQVAKTLRETDGLAMSSRNARLNPDQRIKAVKIFETLSFIKDNIKPGTLSELKEKSAERLISSGFKVDYIEIATANDLELLEEWNAKTSVVILIAAWIDEVRLIDNMVIE